MSSVKRQNVLSVLMPAHNAQRTILPAIRSTLLALPSESSELLVYLDGCTDATPEIVATIADPRLRVLIGNTKIGVSRSLNLLVEASCGEYVARMDADDICLPWRFRSQLRMLRKGKADFVFGNVVLFGRAIRPLGFVPQPPLIITPSMADLALCVSNPFAHPTMSGRREDIIKIGGYPNSPAEDYSLWLMAAMAGKSLARTRSYVLLYRIHKSQITQSKEWQRLNNLDGTQEALRRSLLGRLNLESVSEARAALFKSTPGWRTYGAAWNLLRYVSKKRAR